jgi:hypothetical protein
MSTPVLIDRRRAPRVIPPRPVTAWVAGLQMSLVDLSATGARVEHGTPLGIRREMKLRFEIDGTTLVLSCVVTRCRLQRSLARPGSATYSSGLRFTSLQEPARGLLQSILSSMLGAAQCEAGDGTLPTAGV